MRGIQREACPVFGDPYRGNVIAGPDVTALLRSHAFIGPTLAGTFDVPAVGIPSRRSARFRGVPKEIKGNSGRKPPEPSAEHSEIDQWFGRLVPYLQPIVKGLDQSIRAAVPGLHYAVKYKRAFYGLPELGWIIEMAPYDVSVNVLFFGGADFDPPPPLGNADRTRYVKVRSLDEGKRPDLLGWIEQAGRTPGWK